MLTVVFSSVATERWRLSHVLPWGECVTQSQMVTFPSGDLFSVFVVVWGDVSFITECHHFSHFCSIGCVVVGLLWFVWGARALRNLQEIDVSYCFIAIWNEVGDGKSLVWASFWTRTMGKSCDLLVLTVEGGNCFWSLFRSGLWGSNMTSSLWPGEGMEGGEEGRRERDWEEIGEVQIFLLLLISLSRDEKEEGKNEWFDKHFHYWRYLEICFPPTQLFLWCWEDYKVQVHPIPRITNNNFLNYDNISWFNFFVFSSPSCLPNHYKWS